MDGAKKGVGVLWEKTPQTFSKWSDKLPHIRSSPKLDTYIGSERHYDP